MIKNLKLTILVDNRSERSSYSTEHGFSVWIEADEQRLLFDTGQSDMLLKNAEELGIDLRNADSLVLSHGHYDHTGAVAQILSMNSSLPVYCHSGVFTPRYSRQPDGSMKSIGISDAVRQSLNNHANAVVNVSGTMVVGDTIGITGPVPRKTEFEDTGGAFYLDYEGVKCDPIEDDVSLWFNTTEGVVVVTGCCHSGIVNTIEYIRSYTEPLPIIAVIGGLHMVNASDGRIEKTCQYLQSSKIEKIVPCHCTGDDAVEYMLTHLQKKEVEHGYVGKVITFRTST